MSFMAKRYLRKFRAEDYKKSVAHSFIKPNQKINLFRKNENEYKIDPVKKGQLVTIDTVADPTSQILYFHGGAFTVPMNEDQLEMITQIAQAANSRLQIADFPLLPTNWLMICWPFRKPSSIRSSPMTYHYLSWPTQRGKACPSATNGQSRQGFRNQSDFTMAGHEADRS